MGALRWILLLAGLVFLAALAAWELRRPRQAPSSGAGGAERSEPDFGATVPTDSMRAEASAATAYHSAGSSPGRMRTAPPPRVDLPPLEPFEPQASDQQADAQAAIPAALIDEPINVMGPQPAAGMSADQSIAGMFAGERAGTRSTAPEHMAANGSMAANGHPVANGDALLLPGEAPRPAVVDWPPESERHIISLRIAALSHERLSGRVVRQALGACGFEHGRFGIFHQPGADGRALLSAANLSKPGIFDLPNMDFQRFSGLSLFAVLPGPLPPAAALDHLLDTAQDLAERLRARLQDEHGMSLGAEQLEALRRTVQDLTTAAPEPTA